jgi:hypothetical protein
LTSTYASVARSTSRIASLEMSIAARKRRRFSPCSSLASIMRLSSAAISATSRGPLTGTRTSARPRARAATAWLIEAMGSTRRATAARAATTAIASTPASRSPVSSVRSRTGP